VFKDEALGGVAHKAIERGTGARGLRAILENVLLDVMYDLPSRTNIKKCVITKEVIEQGIEPTLLTEGADDSEASSETEVSA
jgi:ATP-dependent Clp protease ATP-binding subunit ClpX